MRLVYEIESRVRDLRNASDDNEREQKNRRQEKNHNQTQEQNQNSEPDWRPHRQYSREQNTELLASQPENEHCFEIDTGIRIGTCVVTYSDTHIESMAKQRREI
jgi:hypothetical protein